MIVSISRPRAWAGYRRHAGGRPQPVSHARASFGQSVASVRYAAAVTPPSLDQNAVAERRTAPAARQIVCVARRRLVPPPARQQRHHHRRAPVDQQRIAKLRHGRMNTTPTVTAFPQRRAARSLVEIIARRPLPAHAPSAPTSCVARISADSASVDPSLRSPLASCAPAPSHRGQQPDTAACPAPATCASPSPGSRIQGAGTQPSGSGCLILPRGSCPRASRIPRHTLAGANRSCIPLELAPSALVSPAAWCGYPARSLPSRTTHLHLATLAAVAVQLAAPRIATPCHGPLQGPTRAPARAVTRGTSPPATTCGATIRMRTQRQSR